MTDVPLSEFIGYQTQPHQQSYCIISFTRHQSSKLCEGLSIFLLVVLENFCQVWCPKIQWHFLWRRPLQEINFEKRKSPTQFWWLMPREWYNAVALLMWSSLIPDKFTQWNVGRFALLGRTRLMIKLRQNNFYRIEHSITFALIYNL